MLASWKAEAVPVPLYQRTYSWGRSSSTSRGMTSSNCPRRGREESGAAHFTGSLVLSRSPDSSVVGMPDLLVVDGQQRLTTITRLLAALRDHLIESGDAERAESIHAQSVVNVSDRGKPPRSPVSGLALGAFWRECARPRMPVVPTRSVRRKTTTGRNSPRRATVTTHTTWERSRTSLPWPRDRRRDRGTARQLAPHLRVAQQHWAAAQPVGPAQELPVHADRRARGHRLRRRLAAVGEESRREQHTSKARGSSAPTRITTCTPAPERATT